MLKNKNILITGGSGAIGKDIIKKLASHNNIFVLDTIRDKELQQCVNFLSCDITQEKEIQRAIDTMVEDGKHIDICINLAGIMHNELLFSVHEGKYRMHQSNTWHHVLDVNLNGLFYATKKVVEQMVLKRTKGIIINISSVTSAGNAGQAAYSASKAAIEALTVTWAKELGNFGIRFVCISPGYIDSPSMHAHMSNDVLNHIKQETPLHDLVDMEDISNLIIHAIENTSINGCTLRIDKGLRL